MWTTTGLDGDLKGGQCEYAQDLSISQGNGWWDPYIGNLNYCAVDGKLFKNGRGCGDCYLIEFDGNGGTDPGRAGSTIIQVVDSGSGEEFDCQLEPFQDITGASTGVFPVTYTQVQCESSGVFAVVLDGNNSFYTKVLIAGGPSGADSVTLRIGSSSYPMFINSGATWATGLNGLQNQEVSFDITWTDGSSTTLSGCFGGSWPVATGTQCMSSSVGGGGNNPSPTMAPVSPTPAPVSPTPAPVSPTPAPVTPTNAPVSPTPAPVSPTNAPVPPTRAPVSPTNAPVSPTRAPVAPSGPSGGNSCCSLNFKDCVTWCPRDEAGCNSCNSGQMYWLANGSRSGSTCLPRWDACTNNPTGCCEGLVCRGDQYYRQCVAP